jgi:hypothetical protein
MIHRVMRRPDSHMSRTLQIHALSSNELRSVSDRTTCGGARSDLAAVSMHGDSSGAQIPRSLEKFPIQYSRTTDLSRP